jgi:pimeloyl-ACP methyl ester carboxylesterase
MIRFNMRSSGALSVGDLEITRVGSGPPLVLVHGSVVGADRTWRQQLALAEQWSLSLPNRPGFEASPPLRAGTSRPGRRSSPSCWATARIWSGTPMER